MIKSIHLQNFQSHRDTLIEFCEGVNAIRGLSDSGKTAVFRAWNWVVNNQPRGADFTSHWGGPASVALTLADGQVVKRVRDGDKKNEYWLGSEVFKAFGTDPPAEIVTALNFADVNFQFQMDGSFLLSSSPGEVAQYLNRAVHLDKIDSSVSAVRKMLLGVQQDLRAEEARLDSTTAQLDELQYLDQFEEAVSRIEAGVAEQEQLKSRQLVLQRLEDRLINQKQKVKEFEKLTRHSETVESLIAKVSALELKKDRVLGRLKELHTQYLRQSQVLRNAKRVLRAEEKLDNALQVNQHIEEMVRLADRFEGQKNSLVARRKRAAETAQHLLHLEEQFRDEMPDVCPLCDQEVA